MRRQRLGRKAGGGAAMGRFEEGVSRRGNQPGPDVPGTAGQGAKDKAPAGYPDGGF